MRRRPPKPPHPPQRHRRSRRLHDLLARRLPCLLASLTNRRLHDLLRAWLDACPAAGLVKH
jgi:hypothetical protein